MKEVETEKTSLGGEALQRPSLIINAMSNWVILAINMAIALMLTPYIIRNIGKGGYGIWTLAGALVGYFGLLRFGVASAVMRYIPLHDGQNNKKAVGGTFSTAMAIYLTVGLIILAISMIAADVISKFFNQDRQFALVLRLIGVTGAVACPSAVLDAAVRSREKFVIANVVALVTSLSRAVGMGGCLYLGYGLVQMGYVAIGVALISLVSNAVVFRKACPDIGFSVKLISRVHLRYLFSFGAMATITTLGFMLRLQSDKVIVGKFINMEAVGIYSIVAGLLLHFCNIIAATTRVLRPRFGYLDGRDSHQEAVRLFVKSTKLAAVLACCIVFLLMACGPRFIRLWVGSGYEAGYPALLILAIGYMADQSQTVSISLLSGYGKINIVALFAVCEGIANVLLSIFLVQYYGLVGIAAGITIPRVLLQGIIRPIYVCRFLNIRLWSYYKTCLLRQWCLTILLFLLVEWAGVPSFINSWSRLFALTFVMGTAFLLISYQIILSAEDRRFILSKILPKQLRFALRSSTLEQESAV